MMMLGHFFGAELPNMVEYKWSRLKACSTSASNSGLDNQERSFLFTTRVPSVCEIDLARDADTCFQSAGYFSADERFSFLFSSFAKTHG